MPRILRQLRPAQGMKEGGGKRECGSCKTEHFPRTDPVVIMFVTSGDKGAARPAEAV